MTIAQESPVVTPLSALLREGSTAEHREAEGSSFMTELLAGRVSREGYAVYLSCLRRVYAERAQAMHKAGHFGSADMRLAASVPVVLVEKYCNDNNLTLQDLARDQAHQKRFLNDPALGHFRIWKGQI